MGLLKRAAIVDDHDAVLDGRALLQGRLEGINEQRRMAISWNDYCKGQVLP